MFIFNLFLEDRHIIWLLFSVHFHKLELIQIAEHLL